MGSLVIVLVKSMTMTIGRARAQARTRTRAGGKVAVMRARSIPRERGSGGVRVCISPPGSTCRFPHRGDDGRRVCSSPRRIRRPLRTPTLSPPLLSLLVVPEGFPHSGGEAAIATGSRASTRLWRICGRGSRARVRGSRGSSSPAGMAGGARNGWLMMRRRSTGMRRHHCQVPMPMPTLAGGDGVGIGGYTGAMRRRRVLRKDGSL